jgi:hypothetical protein
MPTPVTGKHNLHSLYGHHRLLGVECIGCGRRALAVGDWLDDFKGDVRELWTLRFKCSACGSLFVGNEAEAWLEGLTVRPAVGRRPAF